MSVCAVYWLRNIVADGDNIFSRQSFARFIVCVVGSFSVEVRQADEE